MKMLNLEKLAQVTKKLRLDGVDHDVLDVTVGTFIKTVTEAAAMAAEEYSPLREMELTVEMILKSVPTIDRTAIEKMSIDQLRAIAEFIRNGDGGEEVGGDSNK